MHYSAKLDELQRAAGFLKAAVQPWVATVPTDQNTAKQIALEMIGKSVVIYAGAKFSPAAYKWKISFNENAKQVAWTNQYPEFNHNEFMGWTKQPVDKPYAVVDLRSKMENPRTQKRFEVSARLLSGRAGRWAPASCPHRCRRASSTARSRSARVPPAARASALRSRCATWMRR